MIFQLLGAILLLTLSLALPLFAQSNPLPAQKSSQGAARSAASPDHEVQVAMKNVMYHFTDRMAAHIVQLQGHLIPTKPGAIVVFDDTNSFVLAVSSAEIAISCASLAEVLNEDVFSSADAPIKDVSIESKNNQLVIKGKLHQKGDVLFETTGTISADPDGKIRLHAEHVKAAHLPVKGLLDLLGLDLARLINTKKVHGITAEKDDLILDPEQILPPPHIQGKVTAIRIQGNEVVQVFGALQASNFAAKQPGNYMAYRDGDLHFGKLTMQGADLILIDMDTQDPFDFYLAHYKEQLVAGYTKMTPDFGLRVYMRDYDRLRNRPSASASGQ
ncbi:MAG: hypothetical protein WAM78_07750 [Candidatus Sulfotelmatobacter sp.]